MERVMVLVCGVMGSGKSTTAKKIERGGGGFNWKVISQDDIPAVGPQAAAAEVLLRVRGNSVVIDRINSDEGQRREFIGICQKLKIPALCIWLSPPVDTCISQLRNRGDNHNRFTWSSENAAILRRTYKAFQPPSVEEGFSSVWRVSCEEELQEVLGILRSGIPPSVVDMSRKRIKLDTGDEQSSLKHMWQQPLS
eukprot:TRINITY_DN25455_c0_g1_i1.p1 TRINITY_DN25455_c0_g1~~TRINITY_DN25455_c0_g1_i1.p1  ORF type:complete len:195 (+),score=39.97 TRINITY_DN25455_c0_g1_i1:104-688(+)